MIFKLYMDNKDPGRITAGMEKPGVVTASDLPFYSLIAIGNVMVSY